MKAQSVFKTGNIASFGPLMVPFSEAYTTIFWCKWLVVRLFLDIPKRFLTMRPEILGITFALALACVYNT